jgi:hypothetical protein
MRRLLVRAVLSWDQRLRDPKAYYPRSASSHSLTSLAEAHTSPARAAGAATPGGATPGTSPGPKPCSAADSESTSSGMVPTGLPPIRAGSKPNLAAAAEVAAGVPTAAEAASKPAALSPPANAAAAAAASGAAAAAVALVTEQLAGAVEEAAEAAGAGAESNAATTDSEALKSPFAEAAPTAAAAKEQPMSAASEPASPNAGRITIPLNAVGKLPRPTDLREPPMGASSRPVQQAEPASVPSTSLAKEGGGLPSVRISRYAALSGSGVLASSVPEGALDEQRVVQRRRTLEWLNANGDGSGAGRGGPKPAGSRPLGTCLCVCVCGKAFGVASALNRCFSRSLLCPFWDPPGMGL